MTGVVLLLFSSASNDISKCFLMLLMASVAIEIVFSMTCFLVAFNSCIYLNSRQMVNDK